MLTPHVKERVVRLAKVQQTAMFVQLRDEGKITKQKAVSSFFLLLLLNLEETNRTVTFFHRFMSQLCFYDYSHPQRHRGGSLSPAKAAGRPFDGQISPLPPPQTDHKPELRGAAGWTKEKLNVNS